VGIEEVGIAVLVLGLLVGLGTEKVAELVLKIPHLLFLHLFRYFNEVERSLREF
jgi:hypothetical protein